MGLVTWWCALVRDAILSLECCMSFPYNLPKAIQLSILSSMGIVDLCSSLPSVLGMLMWCVPFLGLGQSWSAGITRTRHATRYLGSDHAKWITGTDGSMTINYDQWINEQTNKMNVYNTLNHTRTCLWRLYSDWWWRTFNIRGFDSFVTSGPGAKILFQYPYICCDFALKNRLGLSSPLVPRDGLWWAETRIKKKVRQKQEIQHASKNKHI